MARKSKEHHLAIAPHEPEAPKPHIMVFCPQLRGGTRSIEYCLYKCPKSRMVKCPEYTKKYPELLAFEVEEKYIAKYGPPEILVPLALRKRRKRRSITKKETEH